MSEGDRSLLGSPWAVAIEPARRDGRVERSRIEPGLDAVTEPIPEELDPGVAETLERAGIGSLYAHQVEAWREARDSNLVITTPTASGKSLAFNLPVLEGLARLGGPRAL